MAELTTQFHFRISDSGITSYRVERLDDRGKTIAEHTFSAPANIPEMRLHRLDEMPYPLPLSGEDARILIGYGETLFSCIFQDDILESWRIIREHEDPIHIALETGTPELDSLPWEFFTHGEPLLFNEKISFSRRYAAARVKQLLPPANRLNISVMALDGAAARHYGDAAARALTTFDITSDVIVPRGGDAVEACREIATTGTTVLMYVGPPEEQALRALARSRYLKLLMLIPTGGGRKGSSLSARTLETLALEEKIPSVVSLHRPAADGSILDFLEGFIEALARGLSVCSAVSEGRRHSLVLTPGDLSVLGIRTYIESDVEVVDAEAVRQARLRKKTRVITASKLTEDPRLRAMKLGRFANMLRDSGEIDRAIETYRETVAAFNEAEDPYNEAVALNQLGTLLTYNDRNEEAMEPLEKAIDIRMKMGTLAEAEMSLNRLAYAEAELGKLEEAVSHYRQAADMNRSLMRREPLANVLLRLGGVLKNQEDPVEAEKVLRECIALSRDIPNPAPILVDAYSHLGSILLSQKKFEEAEKIYRSCTDLADTLGNREEIALAQNNLGNILQRRGDFIGASEAYRRGLEIFNALDQETGAASSLHNLAVVEEKLGNSEKAVDFAYRAREIAKRIGNSALEEVVSRQLDRLKANLGAGEFRKLYNAAMDSARRIDTD